MDNLEPCEKNIIYFLKYKTFVWVQSLIKNNKINVLFDTYEKNVIYFNQNHADKHIHFIQFQKNYKSNVDIVKLKYENYYFIYKIIINNVDVTTKIDIKNENNTFIYNNIIRFLKKIKKDNINDLDYIDIDRLYICPKLIFCGQTDIYKTEFFENYKTIPYFQKFNKHGLKNDDMTILIFYNPDINIKLNETYGFKITIGNSNTLKLIDYVLFTLS